MHFGDAEKLDGVGEDDDLKGNQQPAKICNHGRRESNAALMPVLRLTYKSANNAKKEKPHGHDLRRGEGLHQVLGQGILRGEKQRRDD